MADFGETLSNIGTGIGGFIGGITTPIFGGTTEVSTTTAPAKAQGSNTPIIIGITGIVILLITVGYFVLRK
jgi:hypothetical protein